MVADAIAGPFDTQQEAEETLKSHRPQAEKEINHTQPQTFIDHFYVIEDLSVEGALAIAEYDMLADALDAYYALPADKMRALGAMNTNHLPGSLDFIQCKAGVDTLVEDYLKVEGWQNEEVLAAIQEITASLDARKIQLAPPAPKPKAKASATVLLPGIPDTERSNFRITDDEIGVGTPSQRYANNVSAIGLLKKLEAEERLATPEEQEILSQYVGWGGLSHWFDDRHPKYQELRNLLTEDEYNAARESTLTAFYTPPVVIRAMYQAFEKLILQLKHEIQELRSETRSLRSENSWLRGQLDDLKQERHGLLETVRDFTRAKRILGEDTIAKALAADKESEMPARRQKPRNHDFSR